MVHSASKTVKNHRNHVTFVVVLVAAVFCSRCCWSLSLSTDTTVYMATLEFYVNRQNYVYKLGQEFYLQCAFKIATLNVWPAHCNIKVAELTPGIKRYIHEITERQESLQTTPSTKNVRILCLILTSAVTLKSRASVVNATWARRCDRHFYVLNTKRRSPDIINSPFDETRNNIVHKVKFALNFIYENEIETFDWLLKADDDTYVIIENLKFLLKRRDSKKPAYLGFHFNKFVSSGYMSGGAGYVISNSALRHLVEFGFNQEKCPVVPNEEDPENSEDIEIGRCLNISGVPALSSLDEAGRERFHPYPVQKHLLGSIPEFVFEWAKNPHKVGVECCSKYSISFHYMDASTMLLVDHLLYRTSVFGLNLNDDSTKQ